MKKENKKKVVTLSAMAALLAVVLGMGGKTYAKYFSNASADAETATVAKWGVVVNANVENLWGKTYKEGTDTDKKATITEDGTVVVSGSDTGNYVAPGTTGSMTFSVAGKPEVASKIAFTVTGEDIHLDTYYPIKWTLSGTSNVTGTLADIKTEIAKLNNNFVEPNTPFAIDCTLTWEWAFDNTIDPNIDDTKDSILGDLAAIDADFTLADVNAKHGTSYTSAQYNLTTSFALSIAVTQVQA